MSKWAILTPRRCLWKAIRESYSKDTLMALTNRDVIAWTRTPRGSTGFRMSSRNGLEVWARHLGDGGKVIGWFNGATHGFD